MFKWFAALTEAAPAAAEVVETVTETVAEPVAEVASNALVALPLFTKGLLVTVMGLLGVFLVLTLFFVTIKLMQKIGTEKG